MKKPTINGWAAEYRIPFHVLHFSPKDEYTWGLQVQREISRRKENDHWRLIKKDEPGWISLFGDLTGIEDIHPSRHLEILPYTMGRTILNSETYLWGMSALIFSMGLLPEQPLTPQLTPSQLIAAK